ncbi:MAG: UDP-2,3-diacylglucosamine hydrolase [Bacteroidetes bacterium GWF2_38_335]|nr:MAG: UDP-2,3-diacylglucosamine hydrolase [Bacteroidetes bacterium GWF2_38_335]OFY77581.1 MAG: UDP-2,3-diacylglucosamine hydrolase [Bacteroidetes bacterium RIFOXYA12_FULL_38_20]HBS87118.1 UDP-2,3-diacylglucosamine hydrolase [Bacteroidales bacterium]
MNTGKNIYFVSDAHLGFPNAKASMEREKKLVRWLDSIKNQTKELYLMGDIFDFWFEYKKVVPRGFTRFLGKIAEFTDAGIPVYFFTGNHDIWVFKYLPEETGIIKQTEPVVKEFDGKTFFIGHGDGLGPYDKAFKRLKWIFKGKFFQWLFHRFHPNFGITIAHSWSRKSRYSKPDPMKEKIVHEEEWLVMYSRTVLKTQSVDYFVFGHRHIPMQYKLDEKSTMINLGDWINNFSYGIWDGEKFHLEKFTG